MKLLKAEKRKKELRVCELVAADNSDKYLIPFSENNLCRADLYRHTELFKSKYYVY